MTFVILMPTFLATYLFSFRRSVSLILLLTLFLCSSLQVPVAWGQKGSGRVNVRGYTRKDGTYVRPHTRSRPGSGDSGGNYSLPSASPAIPSPLVSSSTTVGLKLSPKIPAKYVWGSDIQYLRNDAFSVQGSEFRLVGIAFPSEGDPNYEPFKKRLSELLTSTSVGVRQMGVDAAGNAVVRLFVNGQDLANLLSAAGLNKPPVEASSSAVMRAKYPWAFEDFTLAPIPPATFPILSEADLQGFITNDATRTNLTQDVPLVTALELVNGVPIQAETEDPANALLPFQLKVVVLDDLNAKPVPFTDFGIQRVEQGKSVGPLLVVRTNAQGELSASLPSGAYVIESQRETKFRGRLLHWKKQLEVSVSGPSSLTLTDADAIEVATTNVKASTNSLTSGSQTTPAAPLVTGSSTSGIRTTALSKTTNEPAEREQIRARYNQWKQAWLTKNLNQLLAFYVPSAQITQASGEHYTPTALKTKLSELWKKDPYLRLDDLSSPLVRFYGEKAILTVTQKCHSPYSVKQGQKKLSWVKIAGQWLIMEDAEVGTRQWVQILAPRAANKPALSRPTAQSNALKPHVASFPGEKFPATRYRYIEESEAYGWNDEQLRYAVNEMFARHGLDFSVPEVKAQFLRFSWYHPVDGQTADIALSLFNRYEKANVNLLARVRKDRSTVPNIE